MNPYSIPPLMSGFLVLLLGIYVLLNKGSGTVGKVFFICSFSVFIWLVSFSIAYSMIDPGLALFWSRFAYVGVVFLPITSFHFHLELLKRRPIRLLSVLYVIGFGFVLLSWTNLFFSHVKQYFWGYYPQASTIYVIFIVVFGVTLWAGPLLCFKEAFINSSTSSLLPIQLKQLKLVVLAFFIANFGSVDFIAKFGIPVYPFGYVNMVIWFVILAFAINQYRLMDIEMAAEMVRSAKLATVGLLAASINHEIRNPLYVAKTTLESYIEQEDGKSRSVLMSEKSLSAVNRALDVITKLNRFAKPSIDQTPGQTASIFEAIQNVLDLISYEFQLDRIKVINQIDSSLPSIQADQRQLEEILFNLIINACHAMKEEEEPGDKRQEGVLTISYHSEAEGHGHPRKFLRLHPMRRALFGKNLTFFSENVSGIQSLDSRLKHAGMTGPKDKIQIIIQDTGSGISKDQMRHLFEPFHTTKGEKGTGLGLYITKQLVERNGGKISVKSEEGKGTSFILELKTSGS